MFRRVLAAVDFSDASAEAARLAWWMTDDAGELRVIYVDDIPDPASSSHEPPYVARHAWQVLRQQHAAEFGRKLTELVAEVSRGTDNREGPRVSPAVCTGEVVETICQEARGQAELIVMGAHGESGSVRFLFGSIAAKVSRHAPAPVLVIRPGQLARLRRKRFERVVVAVDHSSFSVPAVRMARAMAAPGSTLTLLHVWQPPAALAIGLTGERRVYEVGRMQRLVNSMEIDSEDVELMVEVGSPAAEILEHAEESEADLVVVGAHSRENMVEKIVGTTADRVLRHAKMAVLMIPEEVVASTEHDAKVTE